MDLEKDVQVLQETLEKSALEEENNDEETEDVGPVSRADVEQPSSSSRVRSGTPPRIPDSHTPAYNGTRVRSRSPARVEIPVTSTDMSAFEKALLEKIDSQAALIGRQSEQFGKIKKLSKDTARITEEMCNDVHQRLNSVEEAWWSQPNEGEFYKQEGRLYQMQHR